MPTPKYTLRDTGKMLGRGQNSLVRELKARKILDANRLPAQEHIVKGRFSVQLKVNNRRPEWNDGKGQLYHQTLVTSRGLIWLAQLLNVEVVDAGQERAA